MRRPRPTWRRPMRASPSPDPGPLSTLPGRAAVEVTDRLPSAAVAEVRALLGAALAADGVRPVSEESELRLPPRAPGGGPRPARRGPGRHGEGPRRGGGARG